MRCNRTQQQRSGCTYRLWVQPFPLTRPGAGSSVPSLTFGRHWSRYSQVTTYPRLNLKSKSWTPIVLSIKCSPIEAQPACDTDTVRHIKIRLVLLLSLVSRVGSQIGQLRPASTFCAM